MSRFDQEILSLSKVDSFLNGGTFYVCFVSDKNLDQLQKKITSPKDVFVFIFNSGESTGLVIEDLEHFIILNSNDGVENVIKQLDLFFKKSDVLKKVQFNLNQRFKNDLMERSAFLGQIESKLAEVHQNLVPLRKIKTSNMTLFSKYALGSNVGGEFVDFEKTNDCLFLIMFSTNSYVLSGDLVELVLSLRKNKEFNYSNFVARLESFRESRKEQFDFLATEINFKHLSMDITSDNYKVIKNNELTSSGSVKNVEVPLQANDRIMIESPGLTSYLTEGRYKVRSCFKK